MVDKDLENVQEISDSELVLSEKSPRDKIFEFLMISILILFLYSLTMILQFVDSLSNVSQNSEYILSNDLDVALSQVLYFILVLLVIKNISVFFTIILRTKIRITSYEVKLYHYFIVIPYYRICIRKSEVIVILETKAEEMEEDKKILPTDDSIEKVLFVYGSKKICIRVFNKYEQPSHLKKQFLRLMQKYGIILEQALASSLQTEEDNAEDLSLPKNFLFK